MTDALRADQTAIRLTVVIPSFDLVGLLSPCLAALTTALARLPDTMTSRIVVVDNASTTPYLEADLPQANAILRFDGHHSFSDACNAGYAMAPADAVLFLNNDVFLHPESVAALIAHLGDPLVGIVGARLVYPDGSIQHHGVEMCPEGPFHVDRGVPSSLVPRLVREVQAVTAAAMLVRDTAFRDLAGFSPDFPFGSEDVDLCLRARQRGWSVVCDQSVDSLHLESMTPGRMERDVPSQAVFRALWDYRYSIDDRNSRR